MKYVCGLRRRGDLVTAVQTTVMTMRAWDGTPNTVKDTIAKSEAPLAGFCIIEANDLDEAVHSVCEVVNSLDVE